jgi:hypothetical protein
MTPIANILRSRQSTLLALVGLGAAVATCILGIPLLRTPQSVLGAKVALTLILLFLAAYDWRTHLVPPQISLPFMFTGLLLVVGRLVLWADLSAVPYLIGVLFLYELRLIAGGDAKVALAFFSLWPNEVMFRYLVLAHIVLGIPLLALKHFRTPIRRMMQGAQSFVLSGRFLPTDDDLAQGDPATLVFVAAGVAYLWLVVI